MGADRAEEAQGTLPSRKVCGAWKDGWDLGVHSWRGGGAPEGEEREPRHRVKPTVGSVKAGGWSSMRMWTQTGAPGTSISTCLAPSRGSWSGCACGIQILLCCRH